MTQPWQRQRDDDGELEGMLWFSRFTLYREMGSERTLLGAVRAHRGEEGYNSVPGAWSRAFERWSWKTRAEAWDQHELDRQAQEFREDCDEWRRERFADSRTLREKARQLLRLPVVTRTATDDEGMTYVVEAVPPTTLRAAAGILKTADELARITTRETLPKVELEHTGKGGSDLLPVDDIVAALRQMRKAQEE